MNEAAGMRTMLFVRRYHGMLGGHLKVFDYVRHTRASGLYEPVLFLTPDSEQPPQEYLPHGMRIVRAPLQADAFFVAGRNWQILDQAGFDLGRRPVVNLIQSLRHALPADPRSAYLRRPALRICVSEAVFAAVCGTGLANGPAICIPNGIDPVRFEKYAAAAKTPSVFIAGAKDPELAAAIAAALPEARVDLLHRLVSREEFLTRMASCTVAVVLPAPDEGFFLPGLEAMASGCAVVLPRCEGAGSYALDGETCLVPDPAAESIAQAARSLLQNASLAGKLRRGARLAVQRHSLERERSAYAAALAALPG